MTALTTPPLSTLLPRLLDEADATTAALRSQMASLSPEDQKKAIASGDYRATYTRMKDFHLAVARDTAKLLYMLARSSGARTIVEYGTSFGVSTLFMAAALRDNGGGRLIGTEFEPSKVAKARENVAAGGLSDLVEIREGDALETLARDLPDGIDLVLLDGAKELYRKVLALVEPRLRSGALVVADNSDWVPDYLQHVRAPGSGYLCVPLAADVELSMRL